MQPSFREIISDIKKGNCSKVYLLMGEEDYYIDMLVNAFESSVISEEDKDFNYNVYYGVDADIDTVVASAQQLPVMASKRLVILKEAQSMPKAKTQLDKLAPYVAHASESTVFVVAYKGENLNATSALMKSASKSGSVIFKSARVKDYQLASHVKDYCSARKVGIDDRAVEILCEYIGGPLTKLFGEVNKLIQIKGNNGRINEADVDAHIGISKEFNNFELISAISKKNYPKAVQIVAYFKANSKANPTVLTTAQLFSFFSKLVIAHYAPDKSEAGIKAALGLRYPGAWYEIRDGLRNYNPLSAFNAIQAIREFDVQSKGVGSFKNEYDLLLELIFKLFT